MISLKPNILSAGKVSGIENISDLKGKKDSLTRGTLLDFYPGRLLNLHGMSMRDVTLVDLLPWLWAQAITNSSIGALMTGDISIKFKSDCEITLCFGQLKAT